MSYARDAARTLFINDEGELRCGLRVLVFFVVFLILSTLFAVLAAIGGVILAVQDAIGGTYADVSPAQKLAGSFIITIINLFSVILASALCAHLLERRDGGVGVDADHARNTTSATARGGRLLHPLNGRHVGHI